MCRGRRLPIDRLYIHPRIARIDANCCCLAWSRAFPDSGRPQLIRVNSRNSRITSPQTPLNRRERQMKKMAGYTANSITVEVTTPPIMGVAMRFITSAPAPWLQRMGRRPAMSSAHERDRVGRERRQRTCGSRPEEEGEHHHGTVAALGERAED